MKPIIAFALLGALVVADQTDVDLKGIAAYPTISLSGFNWKNKVAKFVQTLNDYSNQQPIYVLEEAGKKMKIIGDVIVIASQGQQKFCDEISLDWLGRVYYDGAEIKGAQGIIGGNKDSMGELNENIVKKIGDGMKAGEACLSSIPNELMIFGEATFDAAASIASGTAKMITRIGEDTWSKFVPLKQADKDDIAKLMKSGMNLAWEPVKILKEGAGNGCKVVKDGFGLVAGVPLAVGGSLARTGADMFSTGVGMFGRLADNTRNLGENMAGIKKY